MPAPPIIVETGAGLPNANSYVSLVEAQAYIETRLNSDEWNAADADEKTIAVLMATRSVDVNMEWLGYRAQLAQALDWPRLWVQDKRYSFNWWIRDPLAPIGIYGPTYPPNAVPVRVKEATIELAAEMLKKDRAAEWDALGVQSVGLGQGAVSVAFTGDAAMLKRIFTPQVEAMLQDFGNSRSTRSQARVTRG